MVSPNPSVDKGVSFSEDGTDNERNADGFLSEAYVERITRKFTIAIRHASHTFPLLPQARANLHVGVGKCGKRNRFEFLYRAASEVFHHLFDAFLRFLKNLCVMERKDAAHDDGLVI